jgi:hypothetical protein
MLQPGNLVAGFLFNLLVALLIVRFIYYPSTRNKAYVFTFLAFNTIIFFVLTFLASIEISVGVGVGLFAIFSILRYRTDPIPIREMTYLFIISALPLINAAGANGSYWLQLGIANVAVVAILLLLEKGWGFTYEASKQIVYEKIELIVPERRAELLADLEARTGLVIKRLVVGKVDFLHDVANLKVYYDDPYQSGWLNNADPVAVVLSKDSDAV